MILLFSILLFAQSYPSVKVYGALKDIMHEQDYSGKVKLNLLGPMEDLVGVGAVAGLEGEITLLNGEALVSSYADGMYALDKSTNVDATLLVVSEVVEWEQIHVEEQMDSMAAFNAWLERFLAKESRDIPTAFKLRIDGRADWHVISRPGPGEDHKTAGKKYTHDGPFDVVGFYSRSHAGIFTHKGSSTHMHFVDPSRKFTGHLDEMLIPQSFTVFLPKK